MAKVDLTTLEIINDMLTTTKTGPDVLATIKGANIDNKTSTVLNTLGIEIFRGQSLTFDFFVLIMSK